MFLSVVAFLFVLLFIVANVSVEIANRGRLNFLVDPMSSYLVVTRGGEFQSAGFVALAAAEVLIWLTHPTHSWLLCVPLLLSAFGLLAVVVTAWARDTFYDATTKYSDITRVHVISAGIAFLGALVAEIWILWHSVFIVLPLAAIASTVAIARLLPPSVNYKRTSIEEKVTAAWISLGFLAIAWIGVAPLVRR